MVGIIKVKQIIIFKKLEQNSQDIIKKYRTSNFP